MKQLIEDSVFGATSWPITEQPTSYELITLILAAGPCWWCKTFIISSLVCFFGCRWLSTFWIKLWPWMRTRSTISPWRSNPGCPPEFSAAWGPWEPAQTSEGDTPNWSHQSRAKRKEKVLRATRKTKKAILLQDTAKNRIYEVLMDAEPEGLEEITCRCLCSSFLCKECGARYTLPHSLRERERAGEEESLESVAVTRWRYQRCSIHRKWQMSELVSLSVFSCLCVSMPCDRGRSLKHALFYCLKLAWFQLITVFTLDSRLVKHRSNRGRVF